MRKVLPAAAVLTAALVVPSSALAGAPIGGLTASLTKNSLTVDITTTTADGSAPPPSSSAVVRLPQGVTLDPFDSPLCPSPMTCGQSAPNSRVGTGSATAQLPGTQAKVPVGVAAYNGSPAGTLDLQLSGGSSASFSGRLVPDTPPFAAKLVVASIPDIPSPTGGFAALTDFNTTIGGSNPGATGSKKTKGKPVVKTRTVKMTSKAFAKYVKRLRKKSTVKLLKTTKAKKGKVNTYKIRITTQTTITTATQYVTVSCKAPNTVPIEADVTFKDGSFTKAVALAPCPA